MNNSRKNLIKWILALQSGKYKQGQQALCRKTVEGLEFCCLGVGALTLGHKFVNNTNSFAVPEIQLLTHPDSYYESSVTISIQMRKELGIDDSIVGNLINLNDLMGNNFQEIAKYLIHRYAVTEEELNEKDPTLNIEDCSIKCYCPEDSTHKEESPACPA